MFILVFTSGVFYLMDVFILRRRQVAPPCGGGNVRIGEILAMCHGVACFGFCFDLC